MTVKQLKALIKTLPDDLEVIGSCGGIITKVTEVKTCSSVTESKVVIGPAFVLFQVGFGKTEM